MITLSRALIMRSAPDCFDDFTMATHVADDGIGSHALLSMKSELILESSAHTRQEAGPVIAQCT